MKFRHRIAVFSPTGQPVGHCGAAFVAPLIAAGRATVTEQKRVKTAIGHEHLISAVRLTGDTPALDRLGLRPGSFGIAEVQIRSGAKYYEHRNPWDEVISA